VSFASEVVGQLVERNLPGFSDVPVFPKSRLDAFKVILQLFGEPVEALALVHDSVLEITVASPEMSQDVGAVDFLSFGTGDTSAIFGIGIIGSVSKQLNIIDVRGVNVDRSSRRVDVLRQW
jgi:hypothetical protein